jgi:diguanylate cyclase (GGDEF)-like protein
MASESTTKSELVWRSAVTNESMTKSETVQWRTLGAMFMTAGLLVLFMLLLGVDHSFDVPVITALGSGAVALGLIVITAARRLPASGMLPVLLLAVALVSASVVASGEADTPFAMLYVWIGVEGWYLLRPRGASALTAMTVLASAATMTFVANEHDNNATWWVMVAGTTVAVAALAAVLRLRAERLVVVLSEAATHDPLTGVLNRRGFEERAATEIGRARRSQASVAFVAADLDHFKALNDRFGHPCGDEALAGFAELCRANSRSHDLVARVGGEEFALLLPETGEARAVAIAERIRQAMHRQLSSPDGVPVTASFGVATYPSQGTEIETLRRNADRALYDAKLRGRDRTVAYRIGRTADSGSARAHR